MEVRLRRAGVARVAADPATPRILARPGRVVGAERRAFWPELPQCGRPLPDGERADDVAAVPAALARDLPARRRRAGRRGAGGHHLVVGLVQPLARSPFRHLPHGHAQDRVAKHQGTPLHR